MAARVRFPPPLVFLAALLGGIAMQSAGHPLHLPLDRAVAIVVGAAIAAAGVACVVSARVLFHRTGQSPVPWKPTPELILTGPYRFTRNPMYVGVTLFVVGLGCALDNAWIALFAFAALAIVHGCAVLPEERYLLEKFGDSYAAYRARVRRYL